MRRLQEVEQHRIIATRIRPGHLARIVDVSGGGALIETMYRLLPGTSVELHVETRTRQIAPGNPKSGPRTPAGQSGSW